MVGFGLSAWRCQVQAWISTSSLQTFLGTMFILIALIWVLIHSDKDGFHWQDLLRRFYENYLKKIEMYTFYIILNNVNNKIIEMFLWWKISLLAVCKHVQWSYMYFAQLSNMNFDKSDFTSRYILWMPWICSLWQAYNLHLPWFNNIILYM